MPDKSDPADHPQTATQNRRREVRTVAHLLFLKMPFAIAMRAVGLEKFRHGRGVDSNYAVRDTEANEDARARTGRPGKHLSAGRGRRLFSLPKCPAARGAKPAGDASIFSEENGL